MINCIERWYTISTFEDITHTHTHTQVQYMYRRNKSNLDLKIIYCELIQKYRMFVTDHLKKLSTDSVDYFKLTVVC